MLRLQHLAARVREAVTLVDVITAAGVAAIAYGAALAWAPAGWIVVGVALLIVARYGTEVR
jgi:hypothetical protein